MFRFPFQTKKNIVNQMKNVFSWLETKIIIKEKLQTFFLCETVLFYDTTHDTTFLTLF